jgi:SAM-dependent methyltransferase
MTQDHSNKRQSHTRAVPIGERSVRIGTLIVVSGARAKITLLKERFAEGGYQARETAHFVLFTRDEPPSPVLVHRLAPHEAIAQRAQDLLHELEPPGLLASRRQAGEALAGILATMRYPDDLRRAWNRGDAQAMQRLLVLLCSSTPPVLPNFVALSRLAALYQRACTWGIGLRVLDTGGSHGFVALHLVEQMPWVSEVVALEPDPTICAVAQQMAQARHLASLRFLQADLFSKEVGEQEPFETVLALHTLEGVAETDVFPLLRHLLHLTTRRLVVAVPPLWEAAARDTARRGMVSPGLLEAHVRALLPLLGRGARMWWDGTVAGLFVIERDVAGARMSQ